MLPPRRLGGARFAAAAGIKVDAFDDGLRDEPRFQALIRRLNFPVG